MRETEVGDLCGFLRVTPIEMRRAIRSGELRGRIVGQLAYVSEGTSQLLAWSQRFHDSKTN